MDKEQQIIAGVVGDPVSHSLSPRLHGFWLKKYAINGDYRAFHVKPDELAIFFNSMDEKNIRGVNLTVPHKERALGLVDHVDNLARRIGAINTVYFDESKKMVGTNTDGHGFLTHLKNSAPGWRAQNGPVVIIGAGGAARAVIISLLDDGVPEIRLCNRTLERAKSLAVELGDKRIKIIPWGEKEKELIGCALLVNVTTLGMAGQPPLIINLDRLPVKAVVYDIVYTPLETDLLRQAKERGNPVVDGLGMLLHQAVPGFKAWFGITPEVDDELREYLLEVLK